MRSIFRTPNSSYQQIRFLYNSKKGLPPDVIAILQKEFDFTWNGIKAWWRKGTKQIRHDQQKYLPERHATLGPDLASAHFIIKRGGKVRLFGSSKWISSTRSGRVPLPNRFVKNMYVEGIDASGLELIYESFDNFSELKKLQYLNISNCAEIDAWCLDRLHIVRESLKSLDISGCPQITENALPALAKLQNLKRLRIHNMIGFQHPQLASLMVEEMLPNCVVDSDVDYTDQSELSKVDVPPTGLLLGGGRIEDAAGLPCNIYLDDGSVYGAWQEKILQVQHPKDIPVETDEEFLKRDLLEARTKDMKDSMLSKYKQSQSS